MPRLANAASRMCRAALVRKSETWSALNAGVSLTLSSILHCSQPAVPERYSAQQPQPSCADVGLLTSEWWPLALTGVSSVSTVAATRLERQSANGCIARFLAGKRSYHFLAVSVWSS
jgi:hypothetical protein